MKSSLRVAVLVWSSILVISGCGQGSEVTATNGGERETPGNAPSEQVAFRSTNADVSVSNLGMLYPVETASVADPERTLSRFDEWALPSDINDPRSQTVLFGSFSSPTMDPAKGDGSLKYTTPESGYLLITWNVPQVNETTGQVFQMTHISQYDGSGKFISSISQEAKDAGTVGGVPLTEDSVLAHSVPLKFAG